jgi:translation elongation factor EF-Tu-like GTPase
MDNVAMPVIETEVTLLSAEEGGRRWPLDLSHRDAFYRPHLVVGDPGQRHALVDANGVATEEYLGVQFVPAALQLAPGDRATIRMQLIFYPACDYGRLTPGTTFTVREGGSVIGHGRVLRRDDHGAI